MPPARAVKRRPRRPGSRGWEVIMPFVDQDVATQLEGAWVLELVNYAETLKRLGLARLPPQNQSVTASVSTRRRTCLSTGLPAWDCTVLSPPVRCRRWKASLPIARCRHSSTSVLWPIPPCWSSQQNAATMSSGSSMSCVWTCHPRIPCLPCRLASRSVRSPLMRPRYGHGRSLPVLRRPMDSTSRTPMSFLHAPLHTVQASSVTWLRSGDSLPAEEP